MASEHENPAAPAHDVLWDVTKKGWDVSGFSEGFFQDLKLLQAWRKGYFMVGMLHE